MSTLARTHRTTEILNFTQSDLDITAGNTTAQVKFWTQPANTLIDNVQVTRSAATSGGALSAMTLDIGQSAGGTQFFTGNIITAGSTIDRNTATPSETAKDIVYLEFTPSHNWDTPLSIPTYTVYITYDKLDGEVV